MNSNKPDESINSANDEELEASTGGSLLSSLGKAAGNEVGGVGRKIFTDFDKAVIINKIKGGRARAGAIFRKGAEAAAPATKGRNKLKNFFLGSAAAGLSASSYAIHESIVAEGADDAGDDE